jgi:hypothetical protein
LVGLPSLHYPAEYGSRGKAHGKRGRDGYDRVPLEALGRVIQEFFRGIATLLCGTLHYSYAILYCIGNRTAGTGSFVSGCGNVFGCSFQYVSRQLFSPSFV